MLSMAGRALPVMGLLGLVLLGGVAGCTVYSDPAEPSLAMTTSAEQTDRLFWKNVAGGNWTQVNALLAPNAVWRVQGRVIPRAQIVPWLQGVKIRGVQVTDVALTPAVNDMNLVATVQVQAQGALLPGSGCGGRPQTLSALAVWQQPQPTGTAPKDKSYRGYLLTVHDLTGPADGVCR